MWKCHVGELLSLNLDFFLCRIVFGASSAHQGSNVRSLGRTPALQQFPHFSPFCDVHFASLLTCFLSHSVFAVNSDRRQLRSSKLCRRLSARPSNSSWLGIRPVSSASPPSRLLPRRLWAEGGTPCSTAAAAGTAPDAPRRSRS